MTGFLLLATVFTVALTVGLVLALSSTAIVLQTLSAEMAKAAAKKKD